jgi:hypothetical protein
MDLAKTTCLSHSLLHAQWVTKGQKLVREKAESFIAYAL